MRILSTFLLVFGLSLPANAGGPVVLELFTSQGCSSCPPADALMTRLAAEEDVIILGWHVDYWDYLGWKDEFSRPENTTRQKGYRDRWNLRSLYTPQVVIHGEAQLVGSNERKVRTFIDQFQAEMPMITMDVAVQGANATITVSALANNLPEADVFLVRMISVAETAIPRGENAGRTISYVNVVEDMKWLGAWNGSDAISVTAEMPGDARFALIVQAKDFGPVLGAEFLR
ncbi:MAG: DUF1223 domain-containing protein [Alphaproteobacteria bacterium]